MSPTPRLKIRLHRTSPRRLLHWLAGQGRPQALIEAEIQAHIAVLERL